MKHTLIFLSLFCISASCLAQQIDSLSTIQQIDSLIHETRNLTDDKQFEEGLINLDRAEKLALSAFGNNSGSFADVLYDRGRLFYFKDEEEEAVVWYLKAKVLREQLFGKESEPYIQTLWTLADAYRYINELDEAEALCNEALELQEKLTGKENSDYAYILRVRAKIYKSKEEYSKSEAGFLEAKGIYERLPEKDDIQYARLFGDLSGLYDHTGDVAANIAICEENLNFRIRTWGENSTYYAEAAQWLADLYRDVGEEAKARPLLIKARDISAVKYGKESLEYSTSLNNLGRFYVIAGDFEQGEQLYLEAKEILEKLPYSKVELAYLLNNLGVMYGLIGNYPKSLEFYNQALDAFAATSGRNSRGYANTLANIAIKNRGLGNLEEAEKKYLESISIYTQILGENSPRLADLNIELGRLKFEQDLYDEALAYFFKVQVAYENSIGTQNADYADCLEAIASVYTEKGEFKKAEKLYLQSNEIYAGTRGKEGLDYAISIHHLANLAHEIHDFPKAEAYYLELNSLNRSFIEKSAKYCSENDMNSYLSNFADVLNDFHSFSFAHPNPELVRQNYDNAIFINGLILSNAQLLARALAKADSLTKDIYEKWQDCHRRLAKRYARPLAANKPIVKVEIEAEDYEKLLMRNLPDFKQTRKVPHWQDVQAHLHSNEAAIEFIRFPYTTPNQTDSIFYAALLLRPGWDAPKMIFLFEEKSLDSLVSSQGARKADFVSQLYNVSDRGVAPVEKPKKSLYEMLWKPMNNALSGVSKVYFAPCGLMHRLNMGAIPFNADSTLADRYELVQLGSTRQLIPDEKKAFGTKNAVLFGGIQYDMDSTVLNEASSIRGIPIPEDKQVLKESDGTRGGSWNYLSGTEKEVTMVEKIMKSDGFDVQTIKGSTATEDVFKQLGNGEKPSPRILHLATHGFFFPDPLKGSDDTQQVVDENEVGFKVSNNPMIRSGLLMAGANYAWKSGKPAVKGLDNGILTAYEISHLDLSNTELVLLSACETGLGDIKGNEGVFGLQRAFRIAGAKYLIMSLWQVPDKQTSILMTRFYKNWLEDNMTIPEAFHAAQKELRELGMDPYQWAGFVLME